MTNRPGADEYAPFYETYIRLVPAQNLIQVLQEQKRDTLQLFQSISEEKAAFRYAPGKWSIKEVVGHICDSERIMTYRGLRIARGDQTPLPGFEQDDYVLYAESDRRAFADLAAEYSSVREATLTWVRSLDEKALCRRGSANNKPVSVLALAYIIAGHEQHHINLLRNQYLALS
ncbi:MAG: DinB family protein [Terriglobia bacterium]